MRELYPDNRQAAPEHPMTAFPHSTSSAYLLLRQTGNVLFYCTGHEAIDESYEEADLDRTADFGHWYEATPSLKRIMERFGVQIVVHARDTAPVEKESGVAPGRGLQRQDDGPEVAKVSQGTARQGHTRLHPCRIRQAALQTAQPDRDHVRQAQGLATCRNQI